MGWEQLRAILQDARREKERERDEPPIACPIDGAILEIDEGGVRNCPMGNFRYVG